MAVAHRACGGSRGFVRRQLDEGIKCAAANAKRHTGKAGRIGMCAGEMIKRTSGLAIDRQITLHRVIIRHEKIRDFISVAASAAQAHHAPIIGDLRHFALEQHGAVNRVAFRISAQGPIAFDNLAMAAKPGAVPATAGEMPFAGHQIAAIHHHGAGLRPHAPGEHGARISAPNLIGNFRL